MAHSGQHVIGLIDSSKKMTIVSLIVQFTRELTMHFTSWHKRDCHHPRGQASSFIFICHDVPHPAVGRVRAAVERGAEQPDGKQIASSHLHDAPGVVSAYVEENRSSPFGGCDVACFVIAQVVAGVRCGAIFLRNELLT